MGSALVASAVVVVIGSVDVVEPVEPVGTGSENPSSPLKWR